MVSYLGGHTSRLVFWGCVLCVSILCIKRHASDIKVSVVGPAARAGQESVEGLGALGGQADQ